MPKKTEDLRTLLKGMKSVLIAYSGGVDSTFLLRAAKDALGDNVLAVIAESPSCPAEEILSAKELCRQLKAECLLIQTDEFVDEDFLKNTKDRCYFCKKELFSRLQAIARERNIPFVLDGSNYDDKSDFRPGSRAKNELGVRSPLQEAGFTKQDIREFSGELGLPTWDKPSFACLASRVPYGTRITPEILAQVEAGEKFLRSLGFRQLRVRHHGAIVRIEVEKEDAGRIMRDGLMDRISKKFEDLGYTYVTLDLKGYRTGSMNEGLSPHQLDNNAFQ